ncbi:MAG: hypothetical protein JJU28_16710 [Cyclobacteriaceae bacterium]|nr:hypothetical protein [Cyclobacteriaceae bacterium]
MKSTNNQFALFTIVIFIFSTACSEEDGSTTLGSNFEMFELKTSGDINTEITYDERKYSAAGTSAFLKDFETYLSITGTNNDPIITIVLYPPPGHERENDVLGITIRSDEPKPWTLNKSFKTAYIQQLAFDTNHAIISYWDGELERDYISFYRLENSNSNVILKREGVLLKGSISGTIALATFNGRLVRLEKLEFQIRPADDDLSD